MRLFLLLALLLTASAASPAPLLGSWRVDQDASDDIDAILEARGATWVERQAIQHIPITYAITSEGRRVQIAMDSAIYSRTVELVVDNKERPQESGRLGKYTVRHYYDADDALVTVSQMTLPDGVPATFTVKRRAADAQTLLIDWELVATDGRHLTATRVLRREGQ